MIVRAGREKRGHLAATPRRSILTRQQNCVVGDVELDLVQREVRERNSLGEDSLAIAILAGEHRRMIRLHGQLPKLKFFGRNGFLEALRERDLVEKPGGASVGAVLYFLIFRCYY